MAWRCVECDNPTDHAPHMSLDATAVRVNGLRDLTDAQLRDLIASEREQVRAFGPVAEAARTLYELRTGRKA